MSEEKKVEQVEITDVVEKKHTETIVSDAPHESHAEPPHEEKSKTSGLLNPVILLLFLILSMVIVLVGINIKRSNGNSFSSADGDSPSLAAIKADVKAREMELNRQRMAMGLPPLEGGTEPIDDIAARLKTDADTIVALAGRFQQMLGEKDAEITARSTENLRLERVRQDLITENSRINSEYQRALIAGMESESLKKLLAESQATRDAISEELTKLRAQQAEMSDSVTADDFTDLQRRYNETLRSKEFFEARVTELEAKMGKMKLFAKNENDLLPAAVELFRRLRKLEGEKDSDLTKEYSQLGVDLGADVLHTLDFKTGSNELSEADMEAILQIAQNDIPDGDLAFIVGYASKTGDATFNEKLSSRRATAAAQYYEGAKRPGQLVQAVYLGQTNRFSGRTPERNQICEIWRIRAK